MDKFDDIRPYNDDEVRPTLNRVLNDRDFRRAITRLRFPRLGRILPGPLSVAVAWYVKRELKDADSVADVQTVVQKYMERMMGQTMARLTSSGLDKLDPSRAHLFVSNHRDIAMDPAFVDWVLHMNDRDTVRIAIGDNLLTMPFASDMMRLNKSFIVKRSAKGNKEKFKALKHLSDYIHHSIAVDNTSCWIAQRQGRAKDGRDRTETALMKMFAMNKPKPQGFADYIRELSIVPISISYEWDPCDEAKARELYHQANFGGYTKAEHEDVYNIAQGIAGMKGHVHLAFGDPLVGDFNDADELAAEIDRQVIENYVLQPSNCFAYKALYGKVPAVRVRSEGVPFREDRFQKERRMFARRLRAVAPRYRPFIREMYANPIVSKLELEARLRENDQPVLPMENLGS
ncbi:1-acyl-sn-glycerol-3-phosphate acyltransferase [Gilvimarinus sp. F26214L]|uniref:1-acyl-sn-glycerol-3-phosphate acyltransferase n=1 Tax=Gilvimarinus sp. DZF01 TaxID=3461371 RepID=UPI00404529CB